MRDVYNVIRVQALGGFVFFVVVAIMYATHIFWAPYFLINILIWWACLLFSRANLLQQANMVTAFLLYFIYFPVYRNSGGIYSINLLALYPMLFANMYTHRKWGIFFMLPALCTVWVLFFLTHVSPFAEALIASRLYIACFHSIIIVVVVGVISSMEKRKLIWLLKIKRCKTTLSTLSIPK